MQAEFSNTFGVLQRWAFFFGSAAKPQSGQGGCRQNQRIVQRLKHLFQASGFVRLSVKCAWSCGGDGTGAQNDIASRLVKQIQQGSTCALMPLLSCMRPGKGLLACELARTSEVKAPSSRPAIGSSTFGNWMLSVLPACCQVTFFRSYPFPWELWIEDLDYNLVKLGESEQKPSYEQIVAWTEAYEESAGVKAFQKAGRRTGKGVARELQKRRGTT